MNFAAGVLSARMVRRLRRPDSGHAAQRRTLAALTGRLAATAYGREHGLAAGLAYDTFRSRVPLATYEALSPYVERAKRGEPGVLWPGRCSFFALSSGTTAGSSKYLPVTEDLLAHFRRAGLESLLYYTARVGHTGVFLGRHLFLGGSTQLTRLDGAESHVAYAGDLSGIAALNLPGWAERHLYEPGTAIARMDDWPAKLQAIAHRTLRRDITLLAGIPSWVLILGAVLRAHAAGGKLAAPHLKALWPNLECLMHGGVPIAPFTDELHALLGPGVNFHEVYPASEGFIAAQDADAARGLRLLTNAGLFFEFLPMPAFDQANLANLGTRAVPLEAVLPGVDYALILTTPGGFCRYVIGDVVRFLSTDVPRLIYVGRTGLQLSAFGEHVIEKELTDSLLAVCRRHGWTVVNFHVAPVFANTLTGQTRGCHEWWIELRVPTVETPTANVLGPELDAELKQRNDDYLGKRKGGGMEAPMVRLVMPGVFEQWMKKNGRWGGQNKMPRCRSDRVVADQLAELSRFYVESPPTHLVRRR
ncbi:MAG TPA: GH3 auxin-responsive promoter family protein [Opitutaceae bacterium]|nr:GH3 auxin-responsive promoter family protein [Opitutaceae bacterium]